MANLTNNEKVILERLLGMEAGFVLDFTNNSFQDFVKTAVDKDIYADKYERHSGSKANRLRAFWDKESDEVVGKLLLDLLERLEIDKALEGEDLSGSEKDLIDKVKVSASKMIGEKSSKNIESEEDIRDIELTTQTIEQLKISPSLKKLVFERIVEIKKCAENKIPLSAIFLCGSTLEGLLLNVAQNNRKNFLSAKAAPKNKKKGKVLPVEQWKLNDLINTSYEVGILEEDVKRHTHNIRYFRNYIHPHEQDKADFSPSSDTAAIAWKVLKAAINQISKKDT